MKSFAPIVIPTLNRHEHLKRCIDSLSKCSHADKTDLYIFLDYPLNDSHWKGYEIVKAYLDKINGFNKVNIIERKKNFGPVNNYYKSLEYVFEIYDSLIFTEDDNEFAPNFLDYINKGLVMFENNPKIFSICGYNYPIEIPKNYHSNFYLGKAYSAWGYGIWKKKHKEFIQDWNINSVKQKINNTKEVLKISRHINSLLQIVNKGYVPNDVLVSANLTIKEMYCIFPTITKVKNHGHDGSGIHGGTIKGYNRFLSQKIDNKNYFEFSEIPSSDSIKQVNKILFKYFIKNSFLFNCKTFLKYFSYRITGRVYFS